MKVFFRRIHLYLGLVTGLIFTNTCLTGTLLVFQDELEQAFHHDHYYVQPGPVRLAPSALADTLKAHYEGIRLQSVRMYADRARSVEITYQPKPKDKQQSAGQPRRKEGERKGGDRITAYVNPYTGHIIATVNKKNTFFHTVEFLHRQLLASDAGKVIVGTSSLLFLFIVITGLILWWPAKRGQLRQKLTIKRGAGWKRTLHDWHTVLGFYACAFLFCSAITGVAIAFKWANNAVYAMAGSKVQQPDAPPSAQPFDKRKKAAAIDAALAAAVARYPAGVTYQLNTPKNDTASLTVQVLNPGAPNKNATDALYYDQYSAAPTGELAYTARSAGARIRSYYVPVHTGALWGTPSKLIMLLAVLVGSTLPATGVIMWLNRTRKKKRRIA